MVYIYEAVSFQFLGLIPHISMITNQCKSRIPYLGTLSTSRIIEETVPWPDTLDFFNLLKVLLREYHITSVEQEHSPAVE